MIKKYHFLQHTIMLQAAFALAITLPMHDTFAVEANPDPQDKPFKANYYTKIRNYAKAVEQIRCVRKSMKEYYDNQEGIRNLEKGKINDLMNALVEVKRKVKETEMFDTIPSNPREVLSNDVVETWIQANQGAKTLNLVLESQEDLRKRKGDEKIKLIKSLIKFHGDDCGLEKDRQDKNIVKIKELEEKRESTATKMMNFLKNNLNNPIKDQNLVQDQIKDLNEQMRGFDETIKTIPLPITEGNVMQAADTISRAIAEIDKLSKKMY